MDFLSKIGNFLANAAKPAEDFFQQHVEQPVQQAIQQAPQAIQNITQPIAQEFQQLPQQAANFGSFLQQNIAQPISQSKILPQPPGMPSYGPNMGDALNFAHSFITAPADFGAGLALSARNAVTGEKNTAYQPDNPITQFIFGNQPVKNLQGQGADVSKGLQSIGLNSNIANQAGIPIVLGLGATNLLGAEGKTLNIGEKELAPVIEQFAHNLKASPIVGDIGKELNPTQVESAIQNLAGKPFTGETYTDNAIKLANYIKSARNGVLQNAPAVGLSIGDVKNPLSEQSAVKIPELNGPNPQEQQAINEFETMLKNPTQPANDLLKLQAGDVTNSEGTLLGGLKEPGAEFPNGGEATANPEEVAKQARLAHFAANQQIEQRANVLATQANQILKTPEDQMAFRYAIEEPANAAKYASSSSNPKAFNQLLNNYSKFTDNVFNSMKNSGQNMGNIEDYFTHIWDLSTPEAQQSFKDFMTKNAQNFTSGFTKQRFIQSIKEGQQMGLQLKNPLVSQDILQYARSMGRQVSANEFNKAINEARPGGAIPLKETGTVPYNYKGQLFKQSNVQGNAGTFIDPEIQKYLGHYNDSAFADNKVIRTADQANQMMKFVELGLGGFHALKTTARQVINDPTIIPRAVYSAINPVARAAYKQKMIDDGVIDYGSKIGVTFSKSGDFMKQGANLLDRAQSKNPIEKFNRMLFDGLIDTYKMNLTKAAMSKFDLANPIEKQAAIKYGAQINDLMGGLNYEVLNRNKSFQQLLRLSFLAPDFNEGKIRQLATALNPKDWSSAAVFARKNVLGEAVVLGSLAEIGNLLSQGHFDTSFKGLVNDFMLNPSVPLPNNSNFNNPKTGTTQTADLPGSDIADISRAVADPLGFVMARGAALPAFGAKVLSGKDYYGRPLVTNQNNDNLFTRAVAAGKSQLTIPGAQLLKVGAGKETPADATLNTVGFRVKNNPNDPKVIAENQYFQGLKNAAKGLNQNEQNIFLGQLHPTTKDADGNVIVDRNSLITPDKYETLLAHPNLLATEQKFQQSQPLHDPMWDLPSDQLNAFLHAEVIAKNNPRTGFGSDPTVTALYNSLPQGFFQQRQTYFQSLPPQAQASMQAAQAGQPQAPIMPTDISNFWKQEQALPLGTGARTKLLQTPEGQKALAFSLQEQQFTNAQRADMGLPLLTSTSSSGSTSSKSNYGKNALRNRVAKLGTDTYAKSFKINSSKSMTRAKNASSLKLPNLKATVKPINFNRQPKRSKYKMTFKI